SSLREGRSQPLLFLALVDVEFGPARLLLVEAGQTPLLGLVGVGELDVLLLETLDLGDERRRLREAGRDPATLAACELLRDRDCWRSNRESLTGLRDPGLERLKRRRTFRWLRREALHPPL